MGVIERTRNVSLEMRGQDIVGLQRHERAKTQRQTDLTGGLLASKAMILQDLGPFLVPQNHLPRENASRLSTMEKLANHYEIAHNLTVAPNATNMRTERGRLLAIEWYRELIQGQLPSWGAKDQQFFQRFLQPAQTQPAQTQPAQTQPAQTQAAQAQPAQADQPQTANEDVPQD
ncbi:hypothetical protein NCS52_01254600 [Fusarium sp. LHS14.1]|nr:hypothetical protein NCS52_01254600 [Fusarium sp. LHS14.1]